MSEDMVLAAVAAELKRLRQDRAVHAAARDRVVTLSGRVASDDQRRMVVQEILRLPQVDDVRDELEIPLPAGDPPQQLRTLLEHEGVDASGLAIEAAEGVITLTGRTQSWFDRDAAERLAWSLPGVRRVVNQVAIPPGAVDADLDPGVADPP